VRLLHGIIENCFLLKKTILDNLLFLNNRSIDRIQKSRSKNCYDTKNGKTPAPVIKKLRFFITGEEFFSNKKCQNSMKLNLFFKGNGSNVFFSNSCNFCLFFWCSITGNYVSQQ
jgi:hypothetical protein